MAKKGQQPRLKRKVASQASQRQIPTWAWFVIGGILAVALVLGLFYLGNQGPTVGNSIEGAEIFPDPGQGHIDGDISYAVSEPAGGPHNPTWLNCGIYAEPVRVENVIHSMEHGAVWVAYQPELPEDQVEMLREMVRQERRNRREPLIVLAPKPDLEDPIVLTAWRVQLRLDNVSDERVGEFLDRFQRGPFTPEPGAACSGGIGEPLS
ncbi:MAG TPA: DUF3105 domain-containing protein [Anaerolineae bacterium]|jgi:hypothetical protein